MPLDPKMIYIAQRADDGSAWREVYISGSNLLLQTDSAGHLLGSTVLPPSISILSASYASSAGTSISASYATRAVSSSYSNFSPVATSASFATNSTSASFSNSSISSSFAISSSRAFLANFALQSVSSSYSLFAETSKSSSYALTASYLLGGVTINTGSFVVTASGALTNATGAYAITSSYTHWADFASSSFNAIYATNAITANMAGTASHAIFAETTGTSVSASYAVRAATSSYGFYAINSSTATSASYATQTSFAQTASYAYYAQVTLGTASYAYNAIDSDTAISASYATNAGHADLSTTASYALYAQISLGTASYAELAATASNAIWAYDAAHAVTASHALFSDWAVSSSWAGRAAYTYGTSSYANKADFAYVADEATHTPNADLAITASYAHFAQVALGTASYAESAGVANYATSSGYATSAGDAQTAVSASYATYAQIALGTASYALGAEGATYATQSGHAVTADSSTTSSHAMFAEWAVSASWAGRAEYTYGTSSYADKATYAFTTSYAPQAGDAQTSVTASYAHFAQVVLGTSSFAINAETASYLNMAGGTASYAMYALNAGLAANATNASNADYATSAGTATSANTAVNALNASYATEAGFTMFASSSLSSSIAVSASYASSSFVSVTASYATYALTASYFDGSASGSVLNVGLPTDGYYGSGSTGNIAGIASGDKLEDALDKLDQILDKLVPARPPGLSTKSITLASSYTARKAGTNTNFTNVTDIQTPSFTLVGGMIVTNSFADGNNGTLSALIDGTSIGSRALTSADDTGTYSGLTITSDTDYYVGQSGKAGFWYSLLASVNVQSAIDDDLPHTASLSHTTTGQSAPYTFYIDNPVSPSFIGSSATPSGLSYVSGVPAYVGGVNSSAITFGATASFGFTWRFYNPTRVFSGTGTGIAATNFALPSSPAAGSVISGSLTVAFLAGQTSENAAFSITAFNSKGGTTAATISNTRYRLDSTMDTTNRVTSGIGQFPSTGYGSAFDATVSVATNEELQMLNGQYRYPTGNYTTALPVAGPDYSSVPLGTYSNFRWVTFNLGAVSTVSNLTLTFTNSSGFNNGGLPMTNFALYARVDGATPTTGWIDGNVAYPGTGNPSANGAAALVVASSTSTVKVVTFGTLPKTGNVYVRVGIPSGDAKRFTNITMTAA